MRWKWETHQHVCSQRLCGQATLDLPHAAKPRPCRIRKMKNIRRHPSSELPNPVESDPRAKLPVAINLPQHAFSSLASPQQRRLRQVPLLRCHARTILKANLGTPFVLLQFILSPLEKTLALLRHILSSRRAGTPERHKYCLNALICPTIPNPQLLAERPVEELVECAT